MIPQSISSSPGQTNQIWDTKGDAPTPSCQGQGEQSSDDAPSKRPWRMRIDRSDLSHVLQNYFEPGTRFFLEDPASTGRGLMSPKEVVTAITPSSKLDGRFVVREFPFYTDDSGGYAEFAVDYQVWLSKTLGMAPVVIPTASVSGGKTCSGGDSHRYLFSRQAPEKRLFHTYVQTFSCAGNAAEPCTPREARVCGWALWRFHHAGEYYLKRLSSQTLERRSKTAANILLDAFGWIPPEFYARHPDKRDQSNFDQVLTLCRDRSASARQLVERANHRVLTIAHGDYNPGNVLTNSTGAFQIVDFDDLRIDGRESDIAHFLCQIMVFKSFSRPTTSTVLPSCLGVQEKNLGTAFLQSYMSLWEQKRGCDSYSRLLAEMHIAVYRGVLLGMLQGQIRVEDQETVGRRLRDLIQNVSSWLELSFGALRSPDTDPAGRSGRELWERARSRITSLVASSSPLSHSISRDYWLEKLDVAHHYGPDHSSKFFPAWKLSGTSSYFTWLDRQRITETYPLRPVAYLDVERSQAFTATIERGKLVLGDSFPRAWGRRIQKEGARLLFTVDLGNQLHVAPKESGVMGEYHHCSFNLGSPVKAAGYLQVSSSMQVTETASESGHYLPGQKNFLPLIRHWRAAGHITDPDLHISVFDEATRTLTSFLGQHD